MSVYTTAALVARLALPYADDWGAHHAVDVAMRYLGVDDEHERETVTKMAIACLEFASYPVLVDGGISSEDFKALTYGDDQ